LAACDADVASVAITEKVSTIATSATLLTQLSPIATVPKTIPGLPIPIPISGPDSFSGTLALLHVKKLSEKTGIRYVQTAGQNQGADYLEA